MCISAIVLENSNQIVVRKKYELRNYPGAKSHNKTKYNFITLFTLPSQYEKYYTVIEFLATISDFAVIFFPDYHDRHYI